MKRKCSIGIARPMAKAINRYCMIHMQDDYPFVSHPNTYSKS
ncbi:MAG: hypothetical protein ACK560_00010 [Bacteroidota bacterium]